MKKILTLAGILLASNMMACSTYSGNVRATDKTLVDKIKIGKTTKEEVHSLLGQSTNITKQSNLEIWTYSYTQANIVAKAYIPFANLAGEPPIVLQPGNLTIAFNKSGIVENVASSTNGNK